MNSASPRDLHSYSWCVDRTYCVSENGETEAEYEFGRWSSVSAAFPEQSEDRCLPEDFFPPSMLYLGPSLSLLGQLPLYFCVFWPMFLSFLLSSHSYHHFFSWIMPSDIDPAIFRVQQLSFLLSAVQERKGEFGTNSGCLADSENTYSLPGLSPTSFVVQEKALCVSVYFS